MSDDLSQLDAAIDARFRAVGWQAAGHRDRLLRNGKQRGAEGANGGGRPAAPDYQSDMRELAAGLQAAIEQLAPRLGRIEAQIEEHSRVEPSSALQRIDDRLGVVAEVLNQRPRSDRGSDNGTDRQIVALRADMAEVKARLESLTTVLVEFGASIRRSMVTTMADVANELARLSDRDRLARPSSSTRPLPRPKIRREQPGPREG